MFANKVCSVALHTVVRVRRSDCSSFVHWFSTCTGCTRTSSAFHVECSVEKRLLQKFARHVDIKLASDPFQHYVACGQLRCISAGFFVSKG